MILFDHRNQNSFDFHGNLCDFTFFGLELEQNYFIHGSKFLNYFPFPQKMYFINVLNKNKVLASPFPPCAKNYTTLGF